MIRRPVLLARATLAAFAVCAAPGAAGQELADTLRGDPPGQPMAPAPLSQPYGPDGPQLFRYIVTGRPADELAALVRAALPLQPVRVAGAQAAEDGPQPLVNSAGQAIAPAGESGFGRRAPEPGGAVSLGVIGSGEAGAGGFAGAAAVPAGGWWTIPVPPIEAELSADVGNSAVLVLATPRSWRIVERALRQLDVTAPQVLIEVRIVEVTLTDELRYGLQSIFNTGTGDVTLSEFSPQTGSSGPAFGLPQVLRTFPGFSFLYTSQDITTVLNALEGLTKINVLSSPKLMVINNQTASLQVGNQVPIVSASNSSGLTGTTNEIEYRDTGVILKITPRVNAGGLVLLDIAQEVSDVVPSQGTVAQTTSPTFSTRRIATSIAAQDGQTIALGGLISDSRSRGRTGIPFLSRIPIIGGLLFGRTNDATRRTELLILLRPRVVLGSAKGDDRPVAL